MVNALPSERSASGQLHEFDGGEGCRYLLRFRRPLGGHRSRILFCVATAVVLIPIRESGVIVLQHQVQAHPVGYGTHLVRGRCRGSGGDAVRPYSPALPS